MGMSATQARLLSLTARITDNELRSQMLTNSKLRLADKSSDASSEYMDALNSEKLVFKSYSSDGNLYTDNLTPSLLYTFQSLKNQYVIQNSAGKNLVSSKDSNNFEKSDDLYGFLNSYDLVDGLSYEKYKDDMAQYEKDMAQYKIDLEQYEKDYAVYFPKYQQYLAEMSQYKKDYAQYEIDFAQYEKDFAAWEALQGQTDLYAIFSGAVGTSETADGSGASYCYYRALNGNASCYLHLLNELLDFDGINLQHHTYTASNGSSFQTNALTGGMWNDANEEMHQVSMGLNETDADGNYLRVCDGDDDLNTEGKQNLLEQAKSDHDAGLITDEEYELWVLRSDYVLNADGSYSLKSLKQKTIDMYYIIQNQSAFGIVADDMETMLINFTDGDMQKLTLEEPTPPDEPTMPTSPGDAPVKPDEPVKPAQDIIVNDKEKGQWYINLWYLMNGSETANKVKTTTDDDGTTLYTITNNEKDESKQNYKVLDDNLLSSSEWLQFALSNGIVTLAQASYYNPSANSGKQPEMTSEGYTWNSIIYTNATDIVSQEDSAAISKAEVKYEKAVREIQNEDSKIDQDLKKLDTEHTALQTEYESLKSVIDKNVERSFKAFS